MLDAHAHGEGLSGELHTGVLEELEDIAGRVTARKDDGAGRHEFLARPCAHAHCGNGAELVALDSRERAAELDRSSKLANALDERGHHVWQDV